MSEAILTLPCGILEQDGTISREAVIREMSGRTQTLFGRKDLRDDPVSFFKLIFRDCVASLGGREHVSDGVFDDLLLADRDFILLELRKLSLGPILHLEGVCQMKECHTKNFTDPVSIDDVEVFDLPDPGEEDCPYAIEPLVVGQGEDGPVTRPTRVWSATNPATGLQVRVRYPTMGDLAKVSTPEARKNDIVMMQRILGTSLVRWEPAKGDPITGPVTEKFFADQSMGNINWLNETQQRMTPGPVMYRTLSCSGCGEHFPVRLESSDFFGSRTTSPGNTSTPTLRSGRSRQRTRA
jgi:hypothetical protein